MKFTIIILAVCSLLSGCALPSVQSMTAQQIADKHVIHRDDFRKNTMLDGMCISFGDFGLDKFNLCAFKSDSNTNMLLTLVFNTVRTSYDGWAFWNSAVDQDGTTFPAVVASRNVLDGGMTSETLNVILTRDYLESKAATGIKMRIDGQRAQQVITLPTNYISGFLINLHGAFP